MDFSSHPGKASLEASIANFYPEHSNLTREELGSSITYVEVSYGFARIIGGVAKPAEASYEFLAFFEPADFARRISISPNGGLYVPLEVKNYGMDYGLNVRPSRIALDLSKVARLAYEILLLQKTVNGNLLLETVGGIINSSMEYDFDKMDGWEKGLEGIPSHLWERARHQYFPSGNEVTKGICGDSGKLIRKVLAGLGFDQHIKYVQAQAQSPRTLMGHDVTLVFDSKTANWAIINSKSPILTYNLVPKQNLSDLGRQYSTV